jgi:hypothetical protein
MSVFPFLMQNSNHVRQWTIRCPVENDPVPLVSGNGIGLEIDLESARDAYEPSFEKFLEQDFDHPERDDLLMFQSEQDGFTWCPSLP